MRKGCGKDAERMLKGQRKDADAERMRMQIRMHMRIWMILSDFIWIHSQGTGSIPKADPRILMTFVTTFWFPGGRFNGLWRSWAKQNVLGLIASRTVFIIDSFANPDTANTPADLHILARGAICRCGCGCRCG